VNYKRLSALVTVILLVLTCSAAVTFAATFQGLGFLPEGGDYSYANAISADGSTVVGQADRDGTSDQSTAEYGLEWPIDEEPNVITLPADPPMEPPTIELPNLPEIGSEAFRWTATEGMVGLGFLSDDDYSSAASAVSADGSVIAGRTGNSIAYLPLSTPNNKIFRWTSENGMVGLEHMGSPITGYVSGISADGNTMTGSHNHAIGVEEAFRWNSNEILTSLGYLNGTDSSSAKAISADGKTIVGYSGYNILSPFVLNENGPKAVRWTSPSGMVPLGGEEENAYSYANGVSANGNTIVGHIRYESYIENPDSYYPSMIMFIEGFRWTLDGGMVGLGDLPGGDFYSIANEVSDDGKIIVGYSKTEFGYEAFVWDEVNGMRHLQSILVDCGVDMTGWTLTKATGISADGLSIVGDGINPEGKNEAWIAVIPEIEPFASYYVDGLYGSDDNDGLSVETAFATIQNAIDVAEDGDSVFVLPDVYNENIIFDGKAITVSGFAGVPIIDGDGYWGVSFFDAEGSDTVLKNMMVTNSYMGIFIAGSSPTIQNVNVIGNMFGIEAYNEAKPDIVNCILWENSDDDLFGCQARYSCIEREEQAEGIGNISEPPLFVNPGDGNYRLLSEFGRYVTNLDLWVCDQVTSECINAGDPAMNPQDETEPNGGQINIGAYGGTSQASRGPWALRGDINRDGIVNLADFAIIAENWLSEIVWMRD